jgi:phytoene dehydrogenase-like protein
MTERYDAVIVGGGHNGLVAATMLARAGRSTLVLERLDHVGGAAVSARAFPGVDARVSRYSYLVSLFPQALAHDLDLKVELRRRPISSYTPAGDTGLLVDARNDARTRASFAAVTGDPRAFETWQGFYRRTARLAERLFPTLSEPLRTRDEVRRLVGDDGLFASLFERPLSEVLEATFADDLVRGVVLTDALIGTFAAADDPSLVQNRCFLYHVIGNGTGDWDVPVGGMGAVTGALTAGARAAGAEVRTRAEAVAVRTDGREAEVECADGSVVACSDVLANVAPAVLARLLNEEVPGGDEAPEGSQVKVNMVLSRLPRLRDADVDPREAFAGTFHVNEGYAQLDAAYRQAAAGRPPELPPCEVYCHSLTDPSILGDELRAAGAETLTLFALHQPARLFRGDPAGSKTAALRATLDSLNAVLVEPIEDCLWRDADGAPCLEAHTPLDLEADLGLPAGHIFHRDLTWPFAEDGDGAGRWGVETAHPNLVICGSGAQRGGAVSGIAGHNAARALLDRGRQPLTPALAVPRS